MRWAILRTLIQVLAVVLVLSACMSITHPKQPVEIGDPLVIERESDGSTCEEDEACWDCNTMGNLVCGVQP